MNAPRFDRAEVLRALSLFMETGGVTELRALDAQLSGDRRTGTVSGYFDSPDKLANEIGRITSAKGVYVVANPVNPDLLARAANRVRIVKGDPLTSDADVIRRRWLLIDLDPQRPAGIGSTDTEHESARERAVATREYLRGEGWPKPVLADSGNGWHLMYRVELPTDDGGLIQRTLGALAARFDDDVAKVDTCVHNPARIWKVYGTMACKGDHTVTRPHRMARIVDLPEQLEVVPESMLGALAGPGTHKPGRVTPMPSAARGDRGAFDLEAWIGRNLPDTDSPKAWKDGGTIWTLPVCPFNADHVGGSAYVGRQPDGAIIAGCHHNSCQHWGWKELRTRLEPKASRGTPDSGNGAQVWKATRGGAGAETQTKPEGYGVSVPVPHPRFDPEALIPYGARHVGDYWAALSRSTQTPPEMAALLGLAVASGCVCNVARVRGHGDHVEPAPIWAMVLCEPAARKSAVLNELTAPVVDWEKRQAAELGPSIAEALQRRKIDEQRLKALEQQAAKPTEQAKAGRAQDDAIRLARDLQAEELPTLPVLLTSEPTPEALARQMVANHGRALLASAEGDVLDILQGRYSGSRNYGLLLKGHAGDPVRAARVGRPGDSIDRPAIAVALCIQPQAVRDVWSDPHAKGRGLLARFAVIAPEDRIGFRAIRPDPVPARLRSAWTDTLGRLLSFEPGEELATVSLSAEADALYFAFQSRTERALGCGDLADRQAWGGKLCGLVLRIALTLHAIRTWGRSGRPTDYTTIDAETIRAAIAWADYLAAAEAHARHRIGETETDAAARALAKWVESNGGSATASEAARGLRIYRDARDGAERAEQALKALAAAGFGDWEDVPPGPGGGRPTRRFRLSHSGTGTETPETPGVVEVSAPRRADGDGWVES